MAVFSLRRFQPDDLMRMNLCNLDPLTETYDNKFYHTYMARWPDLFTAAFDINGQLVGYRKYNLLHYMSFT